MTKQPALSQIEVIPPRSVVEVVKKIGGPGTPLNSMGQRCRIGYDKHDLGLEAILLAEEDGGYCGVVDINDSKNHFHVVRLSNEPDLFDVNRLKLPKARKNKVESKEEKVTASFCRHFRGLGW